MSENIVSTKERKLQNEIKSYDDNIDQYRLALTTESIWLFLATLGCWSVNSGSYLQTLAFIVTLIFFTSRVLAHLKENKSFSNFEKSIKELIEGEFISGPKKEYYLQELLGLKSKRESNLQPLVVAPLFFVSAGFFCLSVFDQVFGGF